MNAGNRWILLGLLGGCRSELGEIHDLLPVLVVAPESLEFGDVGVLRTQTQPLYVSNQGRDELEVTATLDGSAVFSLEQPGPFVVEPGSTLELPVAFAPDTYKDYEGMLLLESNDPERPQRLVPIFGTGVDWAAPDIEISPLTMNVPTGDAPYATWFFHIYNVGTGPLSLGEVILEGDPEILASHLPSGQVVLPDQSIQVVGTYLPSGEGGHEATVTVHSDDPDEETVVVQVLGNGGDDFEFPVAVIDCPSTVLLAGAQYVHLSGQDSIDPAGQYPLEYAWRVVSRPDGADPETQPDPDHTPEIDVYVDAAGVWQVELVVTNQRDAQSPPALCTFTARPQDDLHVELSWNTAQADLDLHLAQGGTALYDVPGDCNWCNKTPDWGGGSNDDDPRLDLDDRGGYGPENINLLQPEDGLYHIRVHYFDTHGDEAVVATVRVWMHGLEVFSESQVLLHKQVWEVGDVNWPDDEVIPVGTVSETTLTGCF